MKISKSTMSRSMSGRVNKLRQTNDQLPEAAELQLCLTQLCELVPSLQKRLSVDGPTASQSDASSVNVLQHVIDYIGDLQDCLNEDSRTRQSLVSFRCSSRRFVWVIFILHLSSLSKYFEKLRSMRYFGL